MSNVSTGIRNNNYLNVKQGADPWMDAGGVRSRTDSRGHAVFSDPVWGIRAGLITLRTYYLRHGLQTIRQILSRWAPVTDTVGSRPGNPANDPGEYSRFVARQTGLDADQRLELFHADGTIDHVGRLSAIFKAMAAFEIGGGFRVPERELAAGLELIQPGIRTEGTNAGEPLVVPAPVAESRFRIAASVGRVDRGAVNRKADVETVQTMLRAAAMIARDPQLDPGAIDGEIDAKAARSATVQAIVAFQRRFFSNPDGLIEPGGRTWRELLALTGGASDGTGDGAGADAGPAEFFPFAALPAESWSTGMRRFAANRGGGRAHAGCDLYFPAGTVIHAIADGTVVRGPYPFYMGTYALEVDHGTLLARYGEIREAALVSTGDRVRAGMPIARVGHLEGGDLPSDMLHLELYSKQASGPLTTSAAAGAVAANGRPFMRRRDLMDPTPFLDRWKDHLPGGSAPGPLTPVLDGLAAAARPAAVPDNGFCIYMRRIRQEEREGMGFARTVAEYQCYWNGAALEDMGGQMVERQGPGDNSRTGKEQHRRIQAKTYRLHIQAGTRYMTYGYEENGALPGLLLDEDQTTVRSAILIHPCHHAHGYVSSIGCLNPGTGLINAKSKINLADSKARVVAIIEAMKAKMGRDFPRSGVIPGALIIIEGEPG